MVRRSILAAVAAGLCLSASAHAQSAGTSLVDRLGMFRNSNENQRPAHEAQRSTAAQRTAAQRPMMQDRYVQPAAVAAALGKPSNPSRSSRSAAQDSGAQTQSRGLFSGFRLPNLIPNGLRSQDDDSLEPPMPYDDQDVQPQPQAKRQPPRATARTQSNAPATRSNQSANRGTQAASRNGQSAARPAQSTPRVAQRSTTPVAKAKPQTALATPRSSPKDDGRRNELAEALSGLQDADSAEPAKKTTESASDTPSYLRRGTAKTATPPAPKTQAAAPTASRPTPRTTASRSLDVRDALLGQQDSADEIAAQAADALDDEYQTPVAPVAAPTNKQAASKSGVDETTSQGQQLGGLRASQAPAVAAKPSTPAATTATAATLSAAAKADWPTSSDLRPGADVLFSSRQPVIVSKVEGPQRIAVGRPAEYKVTIENRGEDAARDVSANIDVPASAEVTDASATSGVVQRAGATPGQSAVAVSWQLYELAPHASQTLTLSLVPRAGQPMQLGVKWTHAPVAGQTTVDVQEPKLQMEIAGPAEVMFGKSQRYSLTLTNPGTGAADDVNIDLTPPGGDARSMVHHRLGSLAAGQSKKIELELTAREAGELKIQAAATATGDLHASAVKNVLCRKAALEIEWRGPDKNFAGAVATYFFRVRNPGTAPADQVSVAVELPKGCELIDASEGNTWDAAKSSVVWQAGVLEASEQRFLQLRCRLSQPGMNKMTLSARTASGDLTDSKSVPVTVEALADLKLNVSDPQGIVPVGEMAIYEIHVSNRGLTAARGVNVIAMFSEGIDPTNVDGGQYAIRDGRVTFHAIDSLAAGGEVVFRIHAKAVQPGTHIFRAEVVCDDLQTKLSAEETTRFFVEEQRWADASSAYESAAAPTMR